MFLAGPYLVVHAVIVSTSVLDQLAKVGAKSTVDIAKKKAMV